MPGWVPLSDRAPRRRLFVLAMTAVLVAVGLAATGSVVREWGVPPRAGPDDMGTVVLVPGYGGARGALESLAVRLEVVGRPTVVVSLPGGGTGDLDTQAAAVDGVVRELVRHGETAVDLVGYSAGGVAAWRYLQTGRTAPAVRRFVTLASPLQGTEVAALAATLTPEACAAACRQLTPGSALLTGLAAGPRPTVPWLSVWTDADEVVVPPSSAALPGVASVRLQSVCPASITRHGALPVDGLAVGLLLRALGTRPLPSPGTADCDRLQGEGIGRPVLVGTV
jgi:triacylglycerol lipase